MEHIDDPIDIYNYMLDNDIGTSLAIYYKSYADHLELIGATKKADEIYNLGINRNAEPLDSLKEFKGFVYWSIRLNLEAVIIKDKIFEFSFEVNILHLIGSCFYG